METEEDKSVEWAIDFDMHVNMDMDEDMDLLNWSVDEGVGQLLSSDLQFEPLTYESGPPSPKKRKWFILSIPNGDQMLPSANGAQMPPSANGSPTKSNDSNSNTTRSCQSCGCFGLKSEFFKPNFCVEACYKMQPKAANDNGSSTGFVNKNAPLKLFKQPALPPRHNFTVGELLEAIDPENQSVISVVSVADVIGHRLKLHFEDFSDQFDFYVNADSIDIFPMTWNATGNYGISLQPYDQPSPFMLWAERDNFEITREDFSIVSEVRVGMKLEAVDIRNVSSMIICVATVIAVMGDRFLIHFDSWDHIYDYWADLTCPFIFPIGHCQKIGKKITPPNTHKTFKWEEYLKETNSEPLPIKLFRPLPPVGFKKGMNIEVVDHRNPRLIRPGRIVAVEGHMLRVNYVGWDESYDVRLTELSTDIHPVGYCQHTGHPIEPPGDLQPKEGPCPTPNCNGKGHILRLAESHSSVQDCPYNLNSTIKFPERVIIVMDGSTSHVVVPSKTNPTTGRFTAPTPQNNNKTERKKLRKQQIIEKTSKTMLDLARMIMAQKREEKAKRREEYIFERLVRNLTVEVVKKWTCEELAEFVHKIPGFRTENVIKDEEIDGDAFLLLTKADLNKITHNIGKTCKLYYVIQLIKGK